MGGSGQPPSQSNVPLILKSIVASFGKELSEANRLSKKHSDESQYVRSSVQSNFRLASIAPPVQPAEERG